MVKLKLQTALNMIFVYVGLFLGLFNTLLKTRIITAEEIGLISIIVSIAGLFQYFNLFGIPSLIIRFYPKYKNEGKDDVFFYLTFFFVCVLFLIVVVAFYFIQPVLIQRYSENPLFEKYAWYIIVFIFTGSFTKYFTSLLNSTYNSVWATAIQNGYKRFLHLILICVLLLVKKGFIFYFFGFLVIEITAIIAFFFVSFIKIKPAFNLPLKWDYEKGFASYLSFMFFAGLSGTLTTQIDKIMLGFFDSLVNTGVYTIAITFGNIVAMIGVAFTKITHPMVANDIHNGNISKLEKDYKSIGDIQLYLSIFIFLSLCLLTESVLSILGREYVNGIYVVVIIAFCQVINLATSVCGGIIAFSKFYKFDLYSRIILLVLNIGMNFILIPSMGINGAAIATGVSLGLYNIIKVIYVYFRFHIHPFSRNYVKVLITGTFLFGGFYLMLNHVFEDLGIFGIFLTVFILFILYNGILLKIFKYSNKYLSSFINKFHLDFL